MYVYAKKLTQRVVMEHNAKGSLSLTFYSKCLTNRNPMETNTCTDIKKRGDTVTFDVELQVRLSHYNKSKWVFFISLTSGERVPE